MPAPPSIALFDMDRTVIRGDTATLFTRYQWQTGQASLADVTRVAWWLFRYTLGVVDAERISRDVALGYAGVSEERMYGDGEALFESYVESEVLEAAIVRVAQHQEEGSLVVLATSATRYVALPVARRLGIEHVVCSELEVDGRGFLTGKIVDPLCYGVGKRRRVESFLREQGCDLQAATFYSDSVTDMPLLEAVGRAVAVNPDARLRRAARRRQWKIETWT